VPLAPFAAIQKSEIFIVSDATVLWHSGAVVEAVHNMIINRISNASDHLVNESHERSTSLAILEFAERS
jgi:hypothetical protein